MCAGLLVGIICAAFVILVVIIVIAVLVLVVLCRSVNIYDLIGLGVTLN